MITSLPLGRVFAPALFAAAGWLAVADSACGGDKPAPPGKIRVLFVGNSQIYFNDLPRIVEAISESAPADRPRLLTDRSVFGGARLENHWNKGEGKEHARGKIAGEKWDYVVFQEYLGVASPEEFAKHARLFTDLIRKHGAKPIVLSTSHIFTRYPKGFHEVHDTNVAVARELKIPVAAGGLAWLTFWGKSPTEKELLDLYHADKGHPGRKGSYIYACTLYPLLTGQSPVGLTHRIPGAPEDAISLPEARRFQEAAWQVHQKVNGPRP